MRSLLISLLLILSFNVRAREPSFMGKSPKDGLWEALEYYDIHHKEIVYAQAIWESNYFKSHYCKKYNNLFGLGGSKRPMKFKHWWDSVKAYKDLIQKRYRKGEDYFQFLKRIKYASDPNYKKHIKSVMKKHGY